MTTATSKGHESEAITRGIRVRVTPSYLPERSEPEKGRWIFAYHIRITNESDRSVQLLSRRWHIVDADGDTHKVEGEGVVGRQPVIEPGNTFEYSSFCPLETPWGTMEGAFHMIAESTGVEAGSEERFDIRVARFYLVSSSQSTPG